MAGSSVFFYSLFIYFFFYWRDIANQGFAITLMKVRKYIIKVKNFASLLFRLINVNISVNEQPEWFHRAHFRWPFYTHCTSRTSFRSWSFYRYRKRFGDLDQWPCQVEKKHRKSMAALHLRILKMIVYDNKNLHITELEDTRRCLFYFILFYLSIIKYNDPAVKIWLDSVGLGET